MQKSELFRETAVAGFCVLEIFAAAVFFLNRVPGLGAGSKAPGIAWIGGLFAAAAAGAAGFKALSGRARRFEINTGTPSEAFLEAAVWAFSPLLLLLLDNFRYLAVLNDIGPLLLPVAGAGILLLLPSLWKILRRPGAEESLSSRRSLFPAEFELPARKTAVILFLASVLIYGVINSGFVVSPMKFTGDEPHYLLITESLLHDGDLDLRNNYENGDFGKFYGSDKIDSHAHPGKGGSTALYSQHFPGLSVLVLPFYALGERISGGNREILIAAARLPMILIMAWLGSLLFLMARKLTGDTGAALTAWIVFMFTAPHLFYTNLLYPEGPVTLFFALSLNAILFGKGMSRRAALWTGLGIAVIPWFGIKFVVISLGLFLPAVVLQFGEFRRDLKKTVLFLSGPVISGTLFIAYFLILYGNLSPISVYTGSQLGTEIGITPFLAEGILDILRRIVGFFFDQKIGIIPYAPAYILFPAGIVIGWKKARKTTLALLAAAFIYWAFLMINGNFGGYVPPGRWLFPVFWILALFVSLLYAEAKTGFFHFIKWGTALSGFLIAGYSMFRSDLLFEKTLSRGSFDLAAPGEFMLSLGNSFLDIKRYIPKMTDFFTPQDRVLPIWLIATVAITWLSLKKGKPLPSPKTDLRRLAGRAAAVMAVSLALLAYTFWNVRLENGVTLAPGGPPVHFQDGNHYEPELGGFWTKPERTAFLIVGSSAPLRSIRMDLLSPLDGKTRLRAGRLTRTLMRQAASGGTSWTVLDPVGYEWNGKYLYSLSVREENGFVPERIEKPSKDRRKLGVFVRISVQ